MAFARHIHHKSRKCVDCATTVPRAKVLRMRLNVGIGSGCTEIAIGGIAGILHPIV